MEIWERIDSPPDEVLEAQASSTEELLTVRAWEVKESPTPLGYTVVQDWPKLPSRWALGQVAGVATDSKGRYYVFHRGDGAPSLICFDRKGEVLRSWGEGVFTRPHMVKCDGDDNIWAIDDNGHVLYLYSPEGEVLRTLGTKGVSGEDGSHFNKPTDIAYGREGGFYVSDGYGNKRVARGLEPVIMLAVKSTNTGWPSWSTRCLHCCLINFVKASNQKTGRGNCVSA